MIALLAIIMVTMLDTCIDGHLICQALFFFGNRLLVVRVDDDVSKGIIFIIAAVSEWDANDDIDNRPFRAVNDAPY